MVTSPTAALALDAAAVVQNRLSDINRHALVLGNGDLSGLLWERNGALCLRVTKNDVWDALDSNAERVVPFGQLLGHDDHTVAVAIPTAGNPGEGQRALGHRPQPAQPGIVAR